MLQQRKAVLDVFENASTQPGLIQAICNVFVLLAKIQREEGTRGWYTGMFGQITKASISRFAMQDASAVCFGHFLTYCRYVWLQCVPVDDKRAD